MTAKSYTNQDFFRVARLLSQRNYTFAKTMAENPHWYTVRKTWSNDNDFCFVVQYMRDNGYDGSWQGRKYRYFDCNGWTYWTMGAPINLPDGTPHTIIINRKPRTQQAEYSSDYDNIAELYDQTFSAPEYTEENARVFAMAPKVNPGDRVLEIGCGSGLYFNNAGINSARYVGVDPSAGMLKLFQKAHAEKDLNLICDKFENFFDGEFDLIVSFFGSMSYVTPSALTRIQEMLRPGGRLFLMFYADDYEPVTHQKLKINPHIHRASFLNISFDQQRLGNYVVLSK